MKKVFIILISIFVLSSCKDTKKTSVTKEKNTSQKTNDKVNGQDKVAKSTTGSTEAAVSVPPVISGTKNYGGTDLGNGTLERRMYNENNELIKTDTIPGSIN